MKQPLCHQGSYLGCCVFILGAIITNYVMSDPNYPGAVHIGASHRAW